MHLFGIVRVSVSKNQLALRFIWKDSFEVFLKI